MTRLERTILIDKYLSGEMSAEEKSGFERLLSEGDLSSIDKKTLREEMELQKEIELAIQERGLREMLQSEEKSLRHHQRVRHITFVSLGSGAAITALAAVMLLLFVVAPLARHMQVFSTQYVEQVEIGAIRGDNVYANKLNDALLLMQNGDWDNAFIIVNEVMALTASSNDEEMRDMHNNAEWLKAVCLMHNGKVFKAKRLLRKIANSESHYSKQAVDLLEQL